ncbi:MAG: DinB family protein [Candidatus Korobacteraceae bacterium]
MDTLQQLRASIDRLPARLKTLSSAQVEQKASPESWSPKQELGHLLDSAAKDHEHLVRTQLEDHPAMPDYDGVRWVALHRYQERDWKELVDVWVALNRQLAAVASAIPDSAWSRTCTIGGSEPLTLRFVFDDYVAHMLGHLRHIGVEVDDLV